MVYCRFRVEFRDLAAEEEERLLGDSRREEK